MKRGFFFPGIFMKGLFVSFLVISSASFEKHGQIMNEFKPFHPPIAYEEALNKADSLLAGFSLEQKIDLIGGHNFFFVRGFPEFDIPQLCLTDATAGIHIRNEFSDRLEKSVAFPAPVALAASWNPELSHEVARAIGEECRAGGIAVLLGPGMNIYRISQCGRNFEYFGEDPFLAARMIENFVTGVQSTGTIATLKHFICNNTDYYRRRSNSIVGERALHEIYLPAFKAGIDAGAMAVMTSYNQVNGEWSGQNRFVIDQLLRKELGFKWLVMTDWWSTYDPVKVITSGQDLEMAGAPRENDPRFDKLGDVYLRTNAMRLVREGKVSESDIHRMAESILTTEIAMGLTERPLKDETLLEKFAQHEEVALREAREGMVLLKNENGILPVQRDSGKKLLLTGDYLTKLPSGGGSAIVEGYDNLNMSKALEDEFGGAIACLENPSDEEIRQADVVLVSIGTDDSEGWDRPFELPAETDAKIARYAELNRHVVVIVNSGGGVEMTPWNDKVAGIIYAWYPGQIGNRALAEIISGKINPSGKLPITIEKDFSDSPGSGYIPEGRRLYEGPANDLDPSIPVYDIEYSEGVFVGYRWYDSRNIEPLYHFGYGLSYTTFELRDLRLSGHSFGERDTLTVEFTVENTGKVGGAEVAQLYVREMNPTVSRPVKELKGFRKVFLRPGESRRVTLALTVRDFSYWDADEHAWRATPGEFMILIGTASNDVRLSDTVVLRS